MHDDVFTKTIGERAFTFSPIRLGILRKNDLLDDFKTACDMQRGGLPSGQQMTAMLRILHAAAAKLDPSLTWDQFLEWIDDADPVGGMTQILLAYQELMMRSGFVKKAAAGDAGVGEAPSSQTSISPASTDSSSLPPAGPIPTLTS